MQSKAILALFFTLVAATTAMPTTAPEAAPLDDLVKRSCPSSSLVPFQGGSCAFNWRGRCHNACLGKSLSNNCCPGTVTSKIDGALGRCFIGQSTCECTCMQG
jgi:hypothetical protein